MKILSNIEKNKNYWILLFIIIFFIILRAPSLVEPIWYGDEGIYQVIGSAMYEGRQLYKEIWDNKPPLLYITYAIFNGSQFATRSASLLFGVGAVISFFLLAQTLFQQIKHGIKYIPLLSTCIFAFLFGIPLIEGNIANAENFMLFPIITAALLINDTDIFKKPKKLAFAGLLLGISMLYKVVAIFDFTAFFIFLFFFKEQRRIFSTIIKIAPFVIGLVIPILFAFLYFLTTGTFLDFYHASFTQMASYVQYGNSQVVRQGFLIIKLVILGSFLIGLFIKRHKFSLTSLFIFIWLIFSLFNAFFAQRPYTHYMLVLLPSFILYSSLLFQRNTTMPTNIMLIIQKIQITIWILILYLVTSNFNFYNKTASYYQNFISFIFFNKSVPDYQKFFDRNTPRDYELAQFTKSHLKPKDTLFIWGNNAQVYKLTGILPLGRFTVKYHMKANKQTMKETEQIIIIKKPTLIIITSQEDSFPFALTNYTQKFNIKGSLIYERLF
ncbi:MAG: hypothetical protein EXS44_00720 [Candidatus Levybacteria bacterium]|nr:hypothetical protein [Candidatus Levybacteria bacterium]